MKLISHPFGTYNQSQIISDGYIDNHAELIKVVNESIVYYQARLVLANASLAATNEYIQKYDDLPFYKRFFGLGAPGNWWDQAKVTCIEENLENLKKLLWRCSLALTIELDNDEVNMLLRYQNII